MLPYNETKYNKISPLFSIKTLILVALCLQNTGYTLLRKYATSNIKFSSHGILLLGEIIKMVFSTYMIYNDLSHELSSTSSSNSSSPNSQPSTPINSYKSPPSISYLIDYLKKLIVSSKNMFVLSLNYSIMNILSFVSLLFISAGEFTICAQLKILTTALSSRLFLNSVISYAKWRALVLLVLGCLLVASSSFLNSKFDASSSSSSSTSSSPSSFAQSSHDSSSTSTESSSNSLYIFYGYLAVIIEVCLSGFASTYFEKVIKNQMNSSDSSSKPVSIWERNFQLSIYSIITYVLYYFLPFSKDNNSFKQDLANFNYIIFLVSFLGALGGLLVAATLKYADSILKTLAASGAIVLNTYLSYLFLGGPMNVEIFFGSLITVIAIMNYSFD